jgi:hypothetical protein
MFDSPCLETGLEGSPRSGAGEIQGGSRALRNDNYCSYVLENTDRHMAVCASSAIDRQREICQCSPP